MMDHAVHTCGTLYQCIIVFFLINWKKGQPHYILHTVFISFYFIPHAIPDSVVSSGIETVADLSLRCECLHVNLFLHSS